MITPAISVLSAVEGLSVATHVFDPFIVPITIVILIALFLVQHRGTSGIGAVFGPIMIVWFTVIAILGLRPILNNPGILSALNPWYAGTRGRRDRAPLSPTRAPPADDGVTFRRKKL